MQEQNFKYLIVNQEIKTRKDYFTTIASGDYVTFVSDNTIFSIPFEYFFNKSDNEITKHFKGVLNNDAKEVEYDTFPLKRQHTNSKEQKEFMKAYNSLNSSNLLKREYPNLGDYLNKEQKVIEDWNKKDYKVTTVKVNSSPEDLVKLNILRDCILNKDFKTNFTEDITDLISAEKTGQKHNKLKAPLDILQTRQFPKALQLLALATSYGNYKYKDTDLDFLNFKRVEGGSQTYLDAQSRHATDRNNLDSESGLHHFIHSIWNGIAALEIWAEENKINIEEYSKNYLKSLVDRK